MSVSDAGGCRLRWAGISATGSDLPHLAADQSQNDLFPQTAAGDQPRVPSYISLPEVGSSSSGSSHWAKWRPSFFPDQATQRLKPDIVAELSQLAGESRVTPDDRTDCPTGQSDLTTSTRLGPLAGLGLVHNRSKNCNMHSVVNQKTVQHVLL